IDQTMAAERLDVKGVGESVVVPDGLRLQIDAQLVGGVLRRPLKKFLNLLVRQHNWQHAVLETVVVEDVGKTGGDYHSEAIVIQRPRRMSGAGPAAEVRSGQENARPGSFRLV